MNILVRGSSRSAWSSARGAPSIRPARSSCSTTGPDEDARRGGEAREGYADLLEQITDERPEEAALAELTPTRWRPASTSTSRGEAGPARAAHRGGAPAAAGTPVQGRIERLRSPRRSPSARRATARSQSRPAECPAWPTHDHDAAPPLRGSPAPDSAPVPRSRRAACAPPK